MRKKLGQELVRAGLATPAQIEAAVAEGRASHRRLGEVLVAQHLLDERDVYRALAGLYDLSFRGSEELLADVDSTLARTVPQRFQELHHVMPVVLRGDTLVVATSDPLNEVPELAAALGARRTEQVVVTPTDLRRLRMAVHLDQAEGDQPAEIAPTQAADLLSSNPEAMQSAQRLLDELLLDAVAERASDIHVETYRGRTRIRIRVDGDLRDLKHYVLSDL